MTWTDEERLRFELAIEVLSGEVGRRNAALRALGDDQSETRTALRAERQRIIHLGNRLGVHGDRRISAILERNIEEALREEEPILLRSI